MTIDKEAVERQRGWSPQLALKMWDLSRRWEQLPTSWKTERKWDLKPITARNWILPTAWISKEIDSPLRLSEWNTACQQLGFNPVRPMSDFWPINYKIIKFALFNLLNLWYLFYGSNRNLIYRFYQP